MKGIREQKRRIPKRWGADEKKAFTVICGGFLLLVLAAFLGEWKREVKPEEKKQIEANQQSARTSMIQISKDQQSFLVELEKKIGEGNIHQAAEQLGNEWKKVEEIFSQTPENAVLYVGKEGVSSSLDGMGLAVRDDKTCFYGRFFQGKPEGVCTAIYCLDKKTYQYSMGIWKNGQMEGLGTTGSVHLEKRTDPTGMQVVEDQVSGVFLEDKLDGMFTYQQINGRGEDRWWEIMAQNGRTCLDQRWVFQKEAEEYRLLSQRDNQEIFAVPKNQMHKIWWKNRVPWEEEP